MTDYTIRTTTTPPASIRVIADPSFYITEAIAAAAAAEVSEAAAAASEAAATASETAAGASETAAALSAAAASVDADDAAASAAEAAATLAASLLKADNLSDLADAPTALINLGLTATAAEINALDGVTTSTAQLNSVQQFTGRNLIINGSGRVNQRGYVSGTVTVGANEFTLDRWFVITTGQSLTFTGDASGRTMTAPAGGVSTVIEGASIAGGTYVISWTGTATATVGGVSRASGDTFTLAANTNVTVTFSSGTFTNVQIELGSIPTPFERRPVGQELALCQRYYWRGLPAAALNFPSYTTGSVMAFIVSFPVFMRAVPTVAVVSTGATLGGLGAPSFGSPTQSGGRLLFTSTATAPNASIAFAAGNHCSADAELTA